MTRHYSYFTRSLLLLKLYMAKGRHQNVKMGYTTENKKHLDQTKCLFDLLRYIMLTWRDIISIWWDISSRIKLCGRQECATIPLYSLHRSLHFKIRLFSIFLNAFEKKNLGNYYFLSYPWNYSGLWYRYIGHHIVIFYKTWMHVLVYQSKQELPNVVRITYIHRIQSTL